MTEIEKAWCAGLFDGEGCISIYANALKPEDTLKGRRTPSFKLSLILTMVDFKTVERFHRLVGYGYLHFQNKKKYNPNYNDALKWSVFHRQAGEVLTDLRPYLFSKAAEADVGLEFFEITRHRPGRGGVSPEQFAHRIELFHKMRSLKSAHAPLHPKYNPDIFKQSAGKPRAIVCAKGHPLEGDNLYLGPGDRRECRECSRTRDRIRRPGDFERTVCKNGHPLEGENLYIGRHGARLCRTCQSTAAQKQWDTYHQKM